jgi:hypothetical protein
MAKIWESFRWEPVAILPVCDKRCTAAAISLRRARAISIEKLSYTGMTGAEQRKEQTLKGVKGVR